MKKAVLDRLRTVVIMVNFMGEKRKKERTVVYVTGRIIKTKQELRKCISLAARRAISETGGAQG